MTEAKAPHFLPDRFVQGIPTLKAGDGAGPLHDLVVALHLRMLDHDFVIGDEVAQRASESPRFDGGPLACGGVA